MKVTSSVRRTLGLLAAVAVAMLSLSAAAAQLTFPTPEQAFTALIAAARAEDTKALIKILGPEGEVPGRFRRPGRGPPNRGPIRRGL